MKSLEISAILDDFMIPAKQHSKALLLREEAAHIWFRHCCLALQTVVQMCNNSMAH